MAKHRIPHHEAHAIRQQQTHGSYKARTKQFPGLAHHLKQSANSNGDDDEVFAPTEEEIKEDPRLAFPPDH